MMKNDLFLLCLAVWLMILAALPLGFTQQEIGGVMNLSISQPICINIPPESQLYIGINFTNNTPGQVYPLDQTEGVWFNATHNFYPVNNQANYTVGACSSNTINITICMCPCSNLICYGGRLCQPGVHYLRVGDGDPNTDDDEVLFANSTPSNTYDNPPVDPSQTTSDSQGRVVESFTGPDEFNVIAGWVDAGEYVFLRFWIDPYPDNAPSGLYKANWTIRGVEGNSITQSAGSCGTCSCL